MVRYTHTQQSPPLPLEYPSDIGMGNRELPG